MADARASATGFASSKRSAEDGFTSSRRSAEHGFTSSGRSAEHGFTLIEVMVALLVFAVAALALVRLEGATIRSTGVLRDTLLAQIVARNVAVEALTDAQPPVRGTASGSEENGGRQWRWSRTVQPIGDGDVLRIDVSVAGERGQPLGQMTVVRVPAVPVRAR